MTLSEKIIHADSYSKLADALHSSLGIAGSHRVAIADSLGLWHISPGSTVTPNLEGLRPLARKSRIAIEARADAKRYFTSREFEKTIKPLAEMRILAIDLAERLKRLELLRKQEARYTKSEMKRQKSDLRKDFEAKLKLFGHFSHDLKTPFSMLISSLENMVLHDASVPVSLRLQLEKIRGSIYNVLRSAGHSLDAARLFSRHRKSTLIPYNFSSYVRQIVEVYHIVFDSYGIHLRSEIRESIPAEIDPIQMEKVLNNLLSNAIKHNIPGGIVHLSLRQVGNRIELQIMDNGLGQMAKQGKERATLKVGEKNPWIFSSHGFGLEIVNEFVKANKGKLVYKSINGVGTRVTVSLPAASELQSVVHALRSHNFQYTMHEVELLANERTALSRRRRAE